MIRESPWRAVAVVTYMLVVLLLSSLPGRELSRLGLSSFLLNLGHLPLFAGLAWVTLSALQGPTRLRVLLTAAFCLIFAAMDEWHQSFVPGRAAAVGDVVMDAAGITLGIVLREGLRPKVLAWKGDSER